MAELHARAFGGSTAPAERLGFLRDIFFEHPWRHPEVESVAYESAGGELVGYLGAMPRPMVLSGAPIRVVVSHNFVVDPEHRSGLAAIKLMKGVMRARPDLLIAESNEPARRIFTAIGGVVVPSRSSRWIRPLRPIQLAAHALAEAGVPRSATRGLAALGRPVDAAVRAVSFAPWSVRPSEHPDEKATAGRLAELVERHGSRHRLRPVYTEASMAWILGRLDRSRRDQKLRARIVGRGREALGWYVYYSRAGGIARVLQLGAAPGARSTVLRHLFADALRQGDVAVSGATDPAWDDALGAEACLVRGGSTWVVAHAADPALARVVHGPEAFLGRLEGEGWLRFSA